MIRISQIKLSTEDLEEQLYKKAARLLHISPEEIEALQIVKKSMDARKKPQLFFTYTVDVSVKNEEKLLKRNHDSNITKAVKTAYVFPGDVKEKRKPADRPVIIGMGPAGLFCGYLLAMHGYCPILLERGKPVEQRTKDVEAFWKSGVLNPTSNVQFGEGGAGTFSDGKLNTLVKDKFGRSRKVLEIFVENAAPEDILYESKPHIGTDILVDVVQNMRSKILEWGGEIHFESLVTDFMIQKEKDSSFRLQKIEINHEKQLPVSALVLAIGHSARDTFFQLQNRGVPMEAKAFAVGFRVQHPQSFIDRSQYGTEYKASLPPAAYKLTAQTGTGRGVYSFCMCPGGFVVNASSEEKRLAVNGMSYHDRNSGVANSAIIVSVTPADFQSPDPLSGIAFQRELEEKAYELGHGKIPVQYYGDFTGNTKGNEFERFERITPACKGQYEFANLRGIMKKELNDAFIEGMEHFDKVIPGFASKGCLLAGMESRTSSPVRIMREEDGQSTVRGLFPCGEGAGYAGGIMSAAMDGIYIAEKIAKMQ